MCMTKALGVEGIRIGQITSAHVTCEVICITSGTLNNPNLQFAALPLTTMGSHHDYGIFILMFP